MLLTINQIIKRFRTEGRCFKFSPQTIMHMAEIIPYQQKRIGGKIGYDQSIITAIQRRFGEAVAYESSLKNKTPQKSPKQPQMKPRRLDYVAYNGERDNVDYDWEKNESIIRHAIIESINKVLGENII